MSPNTTEKNMDLNELADRVEKMGNSVKRAHAEESLSVQGRAIAIAMIVTLDLGLFDEVAAALRARSQAASQ